MGLSALCILEALECVYGTLPVSTCLSRAHSCIWILGVSFLERPPFMSPSSALKQPEYFYPISMSPKVMETQSVDADPSEEITVIIK